MSKYTESNLIKDLTKDLTWYQKILLKIKFLTDGISVWMEIKFIKLRIRFKNLKRK